MDKEKLFEFYRAHRGEINGALIGLAIAVTFMIIGFWRTIFLALCTGIGYYIGKRISKDKDYIRNLLDKILPPGSYR